MLRKARLVVAATCLVLAATAPAESFDITGKYEIISPPQPTSTPGKVEVVDVFWYGSPHCFRFLPMMDRFAEMNPDYVEVVRMPAIFRKNWESHARAFYTASYLGLVEMMHRRIFEAVHIGGRKLETKEEIAAFFENHGVPRKSFYNTYDSFATESGVSRSSVMQRRYGVRGVPTVIVNGKYRISGTIAGSFENMAKVIQILADQELRSLAASR